MQFKLSLSSIPANIDQMWMLEEGLKVNQYPIYFLAHNERIYPNFYVIDVRKIFGPSYKPNEDVAYEYSYPTEDGPPYNNKSFSLEEAQAALIEGWNKLAPRSQESESHE